VDQIYRFALEGQVMQEHDGANSAVVLATDLQGEIDLLAFSPCGNRLAVSSYGTNDVLIVDPHTGRQIGRIEKLSSMRALTFLSSDVLLMVHSGVCWRYDLRKQELATLWQADNTNAANLAFGVLASPDGRVVALGINRGSMVLYDVKRQCVRHLLETQLAVVPRPLTFSTDGRFVVFEMYADERSGRVLVIFDTKTGRRQRTYEVQFAQAIAFAGESLGVIDYDRGATYLYELAEGEDPVAEFPMSCGAGLRFAGEKTLELLGQDGSLHRLRGGKSRVVRPASVPADWRDELYHFVPSPDWSLLAGTTQNKVVVWRTDRVEPVEPDARR
jgi:hypothetical protein